MSSIPALAFIIILFLLFAGYSLRVIKEYERAVVYTLGRYSGVKGPGIVLIIPFIQAVARVDMRMRNMIVSENITASDTQALTLDAEVFFRVLEADKALNAVADYARATGELARTAMREQLRKHTRKDILENLDSRAQEISRALGAQTSAWGITVSNIILRQPAASPVNQVQLS